MRPFKSLAAPLFATALVCVSSAHAWAQQVRIIYPQEGQDVRGEVTVRYEGLPPGGYAIVKVDGQFKEGSAQNYTILDTISDRMTFARGDAPYKVEITVLRPGGAQVGTDSVTFNVANNKVDQSGESVRLRHWVPTDILRDSVERYRVFAESNAVIEESSGGAGGGLGGGAAMGGAMMGGGSLDGGGGAGGGSSDIPAPLDWQVAALMRRQVRNINMYNGSANIQTVVQESFERQRKGEGGGGAGGSGLEGGGASLGRGGGGGTSSASSAGGPPAKAPWNQDDNGAPLWDKATETGKYFVKMIEPSGTEINATRKAPTIAIADLLPTFPDAPVQPGSTWETNMTILGDLSTREGINVTAPITFTAYDTILTSAGESRRCAKLESRFRLPDNLSKKIAANLGGKVGSSGGAGGAAGGELGGPMSGGAMSGRGGGDAGGAGGSTLSPDDIEVARTDVARVMWFDMDRRQVVRSEDTIKSYFELPASAAGGEMGGAMMPGRGGLEGGGPDGGAASAPAEPTKVTYNLNVTTWFDDLIPAPTMRYNGGLGTAHSKDSVTEPGISRITQGSRR